VEPRPVRPMERADQRSATVQDRLHRVASGLMFLPRGLIEEPRDPGRVPPREATVPVDLRRDLGLRQGDRVEFARKQAGVYTMRRVVDEAAIDRALQKWQALWPPTGQSGSEFVEEVRGPLEDEPAPRTRSAR